MIKVMTSHIKEAQTKQLSSVLIRNNTSLKNSKYRRTNVEKRLAFLQHESSTGTISLNFQPSTYCSRKKTFCNSTEQDAVPISLNGLTAHQIGRSAKQVSSQRKSIKLADLSADWQKRTVPYPHTHGNRRTELYTSARTQHFSISENQRCSENNRLSQQDLKRIRDQRYSKPKNLHIWRLTYFCKNQWRIQAVLLIRSRIRYFFDRWMGKNPEPGSGIRDEHPGSYF